MILGSGGSAFVDGGLGAVQGLDLFNIKMRDGTRAQGFIHPELIPEIESLELKPDSLSILSELELILPCDVGNPLLGINGSAYIFGPQKGARSEDLDILDLNMEHIVKLYLKAMNPHQDIG